MKDKNHLIKTMLEILNNENPQTVRQVYYQLISRQVLSNCVSSYKKVSRVLSEARLKGLIPWSFIEDRTREPHIISMWDSLTNFSETVLQSYKRDIWETQPQYVEVWLEKDALSGIFVAALKPYRVTLNVGKGFDGWSSIHAAAERFKNSGNKPITILYFGDFDPSGEDMYRSLIERLKILGTSPQIIKCALTIEDIQIYNLPSDPVKTTDTRAHRFINKHGNVSVELDALPIEILREKICTGVENYLDMNALQETKNIEHEELTLLKHKLEEDLNEHGPSTRKTRN